MTKKPKVIVQPTEEPISIEDCRKHLRLDADGSPPEHEDDSLVMALQGAAREWCENFTGRALATQTLEVALDEFPCSDMELWGSPVQSVVYVDYADDTGATVEMPSGDYMLDNFASPNRIVIPYDQEWPTTSSSANAVRVRYVAGYTQADDSPSGEVMPKSIRSAILLVLGHLYENRENSTDLNLMEVPLGAQSLLRPYRLFDALA
jgi:uncharacterized phiE125 gp8 family phage protein